MKTKAINRVIEKARQLETITLCLPAFAPDAHLSNVAGGNDNDVPGKGWTQEDWNRYHDTDTIGKLLAQFDRPNLMKLELDRYHKWDFVPSREVIAAVWSEYFAKPDESRTFICDGFTDEPAADEQHHRATSLVLFADRVEWSGLYKPSRRRGRHVRFVAHRIQDVKEAIESIEHVVQWLYDSGHSPRFFHELTASNRWRVNSPEAA